MFLTLGQKNIEDPFFVRGGAAALNPKSGSNSIAACGQPALDLYYQSSGQIQVQLTLETLRV